MLRGILFDFNGVLLDDEAIHFELFRRVLAEEGIDLSEDEYYRDYVGFDDEAGFRHALGGTGSVSDEALDERCADLCARKADAYMPEIEARGYPFFPGAVELVREVHDAGLALGVVSGALHPEIDAALRHVGLLECFETIVASEHVRASKPDPEGYRLGLERLGSGCPTPLRPREVLAIEDTVAGLEAASAAGLVTLAVAHTYRRSELGLADLLADSIANVRLDWLRGSVSRPVRA